MHLSTATLMCAAALVAPTIATMYCQCENPSHDRIFPGINNICADLSWDWCSTNCNIFGKNCDYCEWIPAGASPDADYDRLKKWCGEQSGYDSNSQTYYKGTDVFCYSNSNKASCSSCGGCAYNDNSFFKRSEESVSPLSGAPAPSVGRRAAYDGDSDLEAPDASVALDVQPSGEEGSAALARECQLLFPGAAKEMAELLGEDDACKTGTSEADRYSVTCEPESDIVANDITDAFTLICDGYGGQEFDDGVVEKRAAEVNIHFV
jgi:hypothetical protein